LPLDERQEKWHNNMFPYKLGTFKKRLLSKPFSIRELDYTQNISPYKIISQVETNIILSGRCDCIAIWVDYDLIQSDHEYLSTQENEQKYKSNSSKECPVSIKHWDNETNDFPVHLKHNLKFFPTPINVTNETTIVASTSFSGGDTDFEFEFNVL
jgi:hypothetical protein